MAESGVINVSEIVDRQKIGAFHIKLIIWSFLIMLLDGYDIMAAAFAAPNLVRDWEIAREALAPMLSASLFGILFGALGFGYLGDRIGRKPAIITSVILFGAATLAAAFAASLDQLTAFRFLAGVGIGGVMPNTISLNAELAPRRLRATLIIIMFTGTSFGGALPGPVAAWLVPQFGWQILFVIGGVIPLALAACLIFALPESVRFLALDDRRHHRITKLLRVFDVGLKIGPETRFTVDAEEQGQKAHLIDLFRGPFIFVTPLLWVLFIVNFMVLYFLNSWMPTLFQDAGASPQMAAGATSLFSVGGVAGGLVLSRFLDRFGLGPVVLMFLAAVPVVGGVGYFAGSSSLIIAAFFAGFCVIGLQFGLNATAGVLYPTYIRSNGVGFAFGIGRLGAVLGPLLGGVMLSMNVPVEQTFTLAALPMLIGGLACYVLTKLHDTTMGAGRPASPPLG